MNFRIQSFTPDGQFVNAFGQLGNQTGTFSRPKGVAADSDGNLYVVDGLFAAVQVFDPKGKLLYYFGSNGVKPGQFQLPLGISMDDRNVIYEPILLTGASRCFITVDWNERPRFAFPLGYGFRH